MPQTNASTRSHTPTHLRMYFSLQSRPDMRIKVFKYQFSQLGLLSLIKGLLIGSEPIKLSAMQTGPS